ncbi:hypothetical protein F5B20DRAFT_518064 [Whalleya microplaca]|nr:hypothetical protein F5B20DRAFT_518064 [Whalleya microplaca]
MASNLVSASKDTTPEPSLVGSPNVNGLASTRPEQRATVFHPFPRLPREIRYMIWKLALEEPRTIRLDPQTVPSEPQTVRRRDPQTDRRRGRRPGRRPSHEPWDQEAAPCRQKAAPYLRIGQDLYHQVPSLFLVNTESRFFANERYNIRFSVTYDRYWRKSNKTAHYMMCADDFVRVYNNGANMSMHGDFHLIQNAVTFDVSWMGELEYSKDTCEFTREHYGMTLHYTCLGLGVQFHSKILCNGTLPKLTGLRTCHVVLSASDDRAWRGIGYYNRDEYKEVPDLVTLFCTTIKGYIFDNGTCELADKFKFVGASSE